MQPLLVFLVAFCVITVHAQKIDLVFHGFRSSNLSLSGVANVDGAGILELTNDTQRLIGHAMYHTPLKFKNASTGSVLSFSTTFVFSISPAYPTLGGHGMAFVVSPSRDLAGSLPSQYLGIFNSSNGQEYNHIFAVEFDTVKDFEFQDIDDNHVGIDVNNLTSLKAATAAFRNATGGIQGFNLKAERSIRCWIDYDGENMVVNVSVAPSTEPRPGSALISTKVNLSNVLRDEMYVGFSASTGLLSSAHRVFGWSFAMNGRRAAELQLSDLPQILAVHSLVKTKGFIVGVSIAGVFLLAATVQAVAIVFRRIRDVEVIEDWELEYGPHRFSYKELQSATRGFRDKELLGFGGFGRVYKGIIPSTGLEVAVKRVSHESKQGLREFVAEIASIGRLRHRNLVQLQGWCRFKGELLLVYDYMPNGSLDKYLFEDSRIVLSWGQRYRILQGVASGLLYLHEEWEQTVVHRDVKASNILLDSEWNGRLGDFGLARLYEHGSNPHTTHVVGTLGYLAPELTKTGKSTTSSDVFAFGALLLEVAGGRRPIEPKRTPEELVLVDWVWELHSKGKILQAVDPKMQNEYVGEEIMDVLQLGLLCSHPLPEARPTMRQVVQILAGDVEIPALPSEPPCVDTPPVTQCFGDFVHSFSSYKNGSLNTMSHLTSSSDSRPAFTPNESSPISLLQGRD